jgi:kynureninase
MKTPDDWGDVFPILKQKTYLANHTMGAVPAATRDALTELFDVWATQGVTAWEGPWWEAVLEYSARMERLLGAAAGTVAPLQNATRAMAGVASCFDYRGDRNKIVMSDLEFTTFYPLWGAQKRLGARIEVVRSEDGIRVDPDRLAEAVDEDTLLVATCHAYFRSGALLDVEPVVRAARDQGAYSLIDGYQVVGSVPVDVGKLGVDFYVGGSHKWLCGGAGAGFLYVRPDIVSELRPRLTGWFGMQDPFAFTTDMEGATLNQNVFRFLDGTPNVPALMAARQGIRIIEEVGVDAIRKASSARTQEIIARAEEVGMQVRTPKDPKRRNGMVCLQFDGSQQAVQRLVERGIVVDWRPDCGLRMGPHFYNTDEDIDTFFEAVGTIMAAAQ